MMNSLPVLPFEKILSYLSLQDLIKARGVCRIWNRTITSFSVKTLCFSHAPSGYLLGKRRLINGKFAQNFIYSPNFELFFDTFATMIFSSLKQLRLCDLILEQQAGPAFVRILNSFGQLQELLLFRCAHSNHFMNTRLQLKLPMLNRILLEHVTLVVELSLVAPNLRAIEIWDCAALLKLNLVHVESVEWLLVDHMQHIAVKGLKNLKYFHTRSLSKIDSTFLPGLPQLKEVHLDYDRNNHLIFPLRNAAKRTDLAIYRCGLLLNGPEDPVIISCFSNAITYYPDHPLRLADQTPLCRALYYAPLERMQPELVNDLMRRFVELREIVLDQPVQNVERFLDFLSSLDKIMYLHFCQGAQTQQLFDRLPGHGTIQKLTIQYVVDDFSFLTRLQHLIYIDLFRSIDIELARQVLERLPFLSLFYFRYQTVRIMISTSYQSTYLVQVGRRGERVVHLNDAIQYIATNAPKAVGPR